MHIVQDRAVSPTVPGVLIAGNSFFHRPFAAVTAAFAAGILVAGWIAAWLVALICVCAVLMSRAFLRRTTSLRLTIASLFIVAGAFRFAVSTRRLDSDISRFATGGFVTMTGAVTSDVDAKGDELQFEMAATKVGVAGNSESPCSGKVLVRVRREGEDSTLEFGDIIAARGRLERPEKPGNPGEFDYADYLARHGIRSSLTVRHPNAWRVLSRPASAANWFVRSASRCAASLRNSLTDVLPHAEAGLMTGIILGGRSDIPSQITDDFTATGSVHILAASGMNLAMTAGLLMWLGKVFRVSKRRTAVVSLVALAFYTLMAGATPSVVRAEIMATAFLLAYLLQREPDMPSAIAVSAMILLVLDPGNLLDIGFQLSFATVIAIVALMPAVHGMIIGISSSRLGLPDLITRGFDRFLRFIVTVVAVSIAAQLGSLPLLAHYFNQVSLVALPANALILLPIAYLMGAGFAVWLVSLLWHPAAQLCAAVGISPILIYIIGAARFWASIPNATVSVPSPGWFLITLYYIGLAGFAYWLNGRILSRGVAA